MQQRITYIDVAKGIGILLVYIGHCWKGEPDISLLIEWIYAFHMPLFFFVSGLLFPNKKVSACTFYRNKCASLIVPYILFSVIHYCVRKAFHLPVGGLAVILHGWGSNALWFIPILLLSNMVHFHLLNGSWFEKILSFLFITMCLVWKVHTNGWAPYCISELPWFYTCFLSGYIMKEVFCKLENVQYSWIYGLLGLSIMTLFVFFIAYPYNSNYRHQDDDFVCWLMRYGVGLLGTISTMFFSISLASIKTPEKLFSWFGRNSMVILCTHQLFYNVLQTINYQPFCREGYNHLIIWMLVIAAILLYNKYVVPIINKLHT